MSEQSGVNNSGAFSLSSDISRIRLDFIHANPFMSGKVKGGKANCDKCGSPFPAIHPMFIVTDEANGEIICYPCNYKRLGIDVAEFYKSKRNNGELEALKLQNQQIEQLKESRKRKKAEKPAKVKKEVEASKPNTPDLFSGL